MGLDWYLELKKCSHCNREEETVAHFNITSNIVPMMQKAGVYDSLHTDGAIAEDHLSIFEKGLADLNENFEEYEALNPENGWGSAEGFKKFLVKVIRVCSEYPSGEMSYSA